MTLTIAHLHSGIKALLWEKVILISENEITRKSLDSFSLSKADDGFFRSSSEESFDTQLELGRDTIWDRGLLAHNHEMLTNMRTTQRLGGVFWNHHKSSVECTFPPKFHFSSHPHDTHRYCDVVLDSLVMCSMLTVSGGLFTYSCPIMLFFYFSSPAFPPKQNIIKYFNHNAGPGWNGLLGT